MDVKINKIVIDCKEGLQLNVLERVFSYFSSINVVLYHSKVDWDLFLSCYFHDSPFALSLFLYSFHL